MASEASVADQAVAEIVSGVPESTSTAVDASLPKPEDLKGKEEGEKILTTVSDDVSNSAETTLSGMEDLEEKNEEKIESNAVNDISSAEETSLLKPKDKEKDEEEKVKVKSATVEVEEPAAEPQGIVEQKEDATATEVVKEVIVENSLPEPPAQVMDNTDDSPAPPVEPPPPADVPELPLDEVSAETPKEPTLPETVTEEAKDVHPSDAADDKHMEPPSESSVQEPDAAATVTLDSDETVDKPQIGESTTDVIEVSPETSEEIPQNETSDSITEDPTDKVLRTVESEGSQATDHVPPPADEPKEDQVETVVPEIPAEKEDGDQNAGNSGTEESAEGETSSEPVVNKEVSDTTAPVNGVAEILVEPAVDADSVKRENTVHAEETATEADKTVVENEVAAVPEEVKASDVVEAVVDQVKNENKEVEVLTQDRDFVVADENNKPSSKELDAEQEPTVKQTLLDNLASETSEDKKQDAERTPVDTTKEGEENTKVDAEAPRSEVPSKKSQGGGNNLLSKVKKSIVKVKKAIIGKSPSSKTMAPEENSDAKAN